MSKERDWKHLEQVARSHFELRKMGIKTGDKDVEYIRTFFSTLDDETALNMNFDELWENFKRVSKIDSMQNIDLVVIGGF